MKLGRSLLIGAVLSLLAAACSETPTSPVQVTPMKLSMEAPPPGPLFTEVTGSVIVANPPAGGVSADDGDDTGPVGSHQYSYSNLQDTLFSFIAWGPQGAVAITLDGFTVPLFFDGVSAGGDVATWSGSIMYPVNGQPQMIPARVVLTRPGIQTAQSLSSEGLPPDASALYVITGTSFGATVTPEAYWQNQWLPLGFALSLINNGGSGAIPGVVFNPTFYYKFAPCAAGYYRSDPTAAACDIAPAGSYSTGGTSTSATPCAAGSYQPDAGQSSCILAAAGSFAPGEGRTSSILCPTGYYAANEGQSSCNPAGPGSYAVGPGATEKILCSAGMYSDLPANSSCKPAPRGTYQPDEGGTPIVCAVGTYNNSTGQTSCNLAPPGYYVPTTHAFIPTECPAGSFTNSSGNSACTLAPAGSYVSGTHQTGAALCAVGTFAANAGQSSCTLAPAGSYVSSTGATSATLCPTGQYQSSTGQTSCDTAPAGSYAAGPGATSAPQCAPGSYSSSAGQSSCALAPAGSYVAGSGGTASTQCAAGYYQPSAGQSSCIAASIGFFVSTIGATSQTKCVIGTTTNAVGSTACVPIPPLVGYDALITAAQTTPGVAPPEVTKLVNARKDLVAGKNSRACKAVDSFVSYVTREKKISPANVTMLLYKSQEAKIAMRC